MKGDAVEEIKSRLSVEDVVADYIELKRAGRNFKALSPFSHEKTPSLMVSPEKQIWHDFSSGKGGNIFSFVMEVEGLDFKGALELLARKAGVDLDDYRSKSSDHSSKLKKRLTEALELATRFYQQSLVRSPEAVQYLVKKRAFTKETLQNFRLGYSPNAMDGLTKALQKRDFTEAEIKGAGLGTIRYRGFGDMFRGRIMVPLTDPQGAVIGFTARLLIDDPEAPKYINTPQTLLYDKGRHVFGLFEAKQAIRSAGYAVMVEGNLDVIASHQAGIKQVIATAGTALTDYHLKTLARFTSDIRIAFDRDDAGLRATERAIGMAARVGIKLGVIDVPEGKDPDELVRKNPTAWQEIVTKPTEAFVWLKQYHQTRLDITTAGGKREYVETILRVIRTLSDPVEQEHHLKALAVETQTSEAAIATKFAQKDLSGPQKRKIKVDPTDIKPDQFAYQDRLLGLLLEYPLTRRVLETIDDEPHLSSPLRQSVFSYISLNPHETLDDNVPKDLQKESDYVKMLLLLAAELYAAFDSNERLREAQDLVRRLVRDNKKARIQEMSGAIAEAESAGNEALVAELLARFNDIIKEP